MGSQCKNSFRIIRKVVVVNLSLQKSCPACILDTVSGFDVGRTC